MTSRRSALSALARHPWRLLGVALTLSALGVGVAGVALMPTNAPPVATASRYSELFEHRTNRADVRGEVRPASVLDSATVVPATPVVYGAPISRIRISRIRVDAPVEVKGLTPDGTMESPTGPDVVAWYGFTPKPGLGGNAVLSGHVDYINHGAAVFWDLRKLEAGDEIDVVLADGVVLQYAISALQLYPLNDVPMSDVLAPTPTESITLITCGGSFSGGAYTHRLVLRAIRTGVAGN
jgi:LPXTG-site transpeptidase (sortase) family protein